MRAIVLLLVLISALAPVGCTQQHRPAPTIVSQGDRPIPPHDIPQNIHRAWSRDFPNIQMGYAIQVVYSDGSVAYQFVFKEVVDGPTLSVIYDATGKRIE